MKSILLPRKPHVLYAIAFFFNGMIANEVSAQERKVPVAKASTEIERRLDALEKEVKELKRTHRPLLADENKKPYRHNIVSKSAASPFEGRSHTENVELTVSPLKACRILVIVRLSQRSSIFAAELVVNGKRQDFVSHRKHPLGEAEHRTMSTVIDAKPGELLKIESRKLDQKRMALANHTMTLVAMPCLDPEK